MKRIFRLSLLALTGIVIALAACQPAAGVGKETIDALLAQTLTERMAKTDAAASEIPTLSRTASTTKPATVTLTATRTPWPTHERSSTVSLPPPDTADFSSAPCKKAKLVADLTIPDGFAIGSDTYFTKTWRLKNIGSCEWGGYDSIVFDRGDRMDAPMTKLAIEDHHTVKPGETVDISIGMISPSVVGTYQAHFKLINPTLFPEESKAEGDITLWVRIRVVAPTAMPPGTADIRIVTSQLTIQPNIDKPVTVVCPENTRVTGGGFSHPYLSGDVDLSYMENNGWTVQADNHSLEPQVVKVHAFCLNDPNASTIRIIQTVADTKKSASKTAAAMCPKGTVMTGGGFSSDRYYQKVLFSGPYENGWKVAVGLTGISGTANIEFSVYAVCLSGIPAEAGPIAASAMIEYNSSGFIIADCPPGSLPVGGGFSIPGDSVWISEASVHGGRWIVHAYNRGNQDAQVEAHVMCLRLNGITLRVHGGGSITHAHWSGGRSRMKRNRSSISNTGWR